jgi:hypothetical protein
MNYDLRDYTLDAIYIVHIYERIILGAYYSIFISNQLYQFESNPTKSHYIGTFYYLHGEIFKKIVLTRFCGF